MIGNLELQKNHDHTNSHDLINPTDNLPSTELREEIDVSKDDRYTRINIERNFENAPLGTKTKTKIQTKILKDNQLNSKEIYIKKIFISENKEEEMQDVVIREIFVDTLSGKKKVNERKISFKMKPGQGIDDKMDEYIGNTKVHEPLLLN